MAEIKEFKNRMIKTAEVLSTQFDTVRAGRANAAVLDQIEVDYYGTPTPIRQIASISSPSPLAGCPVLIRAASTHPARAAVTLLIT